MTAERTASYPCPCCGYEAFSEPPGSFEICPICYWEDDLVQLAFPDLAGGANQCSLIEGQRNYERFGVCEERFTPHVRTARPIDNRSMGWRPIDPVGDRYLKWSEPADHDVWQSVMNQPGRCDYYWLADYWLPQRRP